jgi:hypothetical protein
VSTRYYLPRAQVARMDVGLLVHLYDAGNVLIGILTLDALPCIADRDAPVAHRSGGRITVSGTGPDEQWAISEYGEPVTLGDLRRGRAP